MWNFVKSTLSFQTMSHSFEMLNISTLNTNDEKNGKAPTNISHKRVHPFNYYKAYEFIFVFSHVKCGADTIATFRQSYVRHLNNISTMYRFNIFGIFKIFNLLIWFLVFRKWHSSPQNCSFALVSRLQFLI